MAKLLFNLGNWAVAHRRKVIGGAVGLLIAAAVLALSMGPAFHEDMSIPGTESEEALQMVEEAFSGAGEELGEVQIVLKAPGHETLESEELQRVIQELLIDIQEDQAVANVATPLELGNLNEDKTIGYAVVTFNVPKEDVTEASKEAIIEKIEKTRELGIQTELTGNVAFSELEIGIMAEVIGVTAAFAILVITFASFLAAGMPIVTAVIGLGIGLSTILIGTNFLNISSVSLTLAAMLGLAVGIDYALFIITRFRQQMAKGFSVKESAAIANGTAGSAVVFAGVTVVIALLGLSIAQIPFLTMMGVAAALCVLIAVFIAVIVVPALLGMIGHKIAPKNSHASLHKRTEINQKEGANKWGKFVTKRPIAAAALGIGLLAVISIPFFHMELGLPDDGLQSEESTERRAYDLLSDAYGPGHHASLIVAAKKEDSAVDPQSALEDTVAAIGELTNVASVSPPIPSPDGELFIISVTPETGPNDVETKELVSDIRALTQRIGTGEGIDLTVTGFTAVGIDISQKLNDAVPLFASFIVVFAFILLVLVFRSILVPLKAVLGFLLSLGATLGFVVFVVQDGHFIELFGFPAAGPVLAFLPVIAIGVLFGLAMDYEVFLVSRMREEYAHTGDARGAILAGMRDSGGVVTAAGLIMIAVFSGFMLAPDPIIKVMGMALAFGILFDAFVVRLMIVPAVMTLLGNASWYLPKWLDKLLPNIDIEGESIMKEFEQNRGQEVAKKIG
ncbi:membrane protein YdfJ [Evansella caseinilytica]|uniref:Membrane protein YdfJ n=1 Tax=Evansella caseinilytica TaxID=1503961 RepID=A0A1H3I3B2_9BACI|nr:MMPL family transporter [Evansella caseinilytica]SDY22197.1 membrane protein YdfJ [Evansella caseinilytica]